MKLCLIKASAESDFKAYKSVRGGPPQSIFSAAAATPDWVDVQLFDEVLKNCDPRRIHADVAVIFFSTPDANRGYEIARVLGAKGVQVAIGGLHATFLPEEAKDYADAVITGECENIWQEFLADADRGQLKPRYTGTPADLSKLNPYPTHLIKAKDYGWEWSVLVSRGCKHHCSFCLIPGMLGKTRYRPIPDIVAELEAMETDWVELHADHLTEDRDYALELFRAIEPLGINWVGETTIRIADDEELLDAAARSGCKYLLIGIETVDKAALKRAGKGFIKPENLKDQIARIHERGIIVDSAAILGFDEHSPDIFARTADLYHEIGVDSTAAAIAIPFPGSRMFKQLEAEGRLLSDNWSDYDGSHAVFQPKQMTPEQLERGADEFNRKFFSVGRCMSRTMRQIGHFGLSTAMRIQS
ncbi:radical SAM protein [Ruegeria sp. Ofav3-42]|uniref:B12-binding domain-containing radical SAM protein n=1 Tax=Ruegeria sp. Ofav3-42 TaxID=2917759 RepID=UPI001EF643A2|nr:radical SAM protein [Ruegeria sp. Ofav3-42]MCG7521835.1 radical SAM protein [Ruegeria sp. Ofav3-42]